MDLIPSAFSIIFLQLDEETRETQNNTTRKKVENFDHVAWQEIYNRYSNQRVSVVIRKTDQVKHIRIISSILYFSHTGYITLLI